MPTCTRSLRAATLVAVAALGVVALVLLGGPLSARTTLVVDDLSQLAAALAAAAGCAVAARRCRGRRRQAWAALAAGCASWAAGQAVWSFYELVLGRSTPFPSPGDLGFLAFPVAATVALLLHPAQAGAAERRRRLLDGVLAAASLALLSEVTAFGAVLEQETAGTLATVVAVAYPVGDVVVLTMVLVLVGPATADRAALLLVGSGVTAIALADSVFLYLTALGSYSSDQHGVSLGWCAGFVLIALGAAAAGRIDDARTSGLSVPGRTAGRLPYAPVLLAVVLASWRALTGGPPDPVEAGLACFIVAVVLLRQYALVRDHARLLGELAAREAELRHQAFHDGLTGLANRALFRDRVGHALAVRRRDARPLTVLFCDLDGFKHVNDTLGHAAGDALLVAVAERLSAALRAADTLARLGGDEFAVLLEDGDDPLAVAGKLVDALGTPFAVAGRELLVRASVGVTTVQPDDAVPSVDTLLVQADTAMYAAKREGGSAVRGYEPSMALGQQAGARLGGPAGAAVPLQR